MSQIKIGWAEESITPDKPVLLAGQFFDRISEYVETPVTATAMAIETDDMKLILCGCDLCFTDTALLNAVREQVCKTTGLLPKEIILSATHTHTSLLYDSGKGTAGGLNVLERYCPAEEKAPPSSDCMDMVSAFNFLTEQIAKTVCAAWENRIPSQISSAFGRAAVGMCRRVMYNDGSAKMWGDTNSPCFTELEGGNDSGIELLYVFDEKEQLTGIVANVSCPSQVVEHRSFISSDYWGKVKQILRKHFGEDLFLLGLCAAAGDQCPRDMIRWVNPVSPIDDPNIKRENYIERKADPSMFEIEGTRKVGKRIANEIISVYEEIEEKQLTPVFKHESFMLELPLRQVTSEQADEAKKVLESYSRKKGSAAADENAAMHVYAGTLERFEVQQAQKFYPAEIHVFRLGDIVFATNPFELFLDYGNRIRALSKAKQTFLIQLSCGSGGYLPTEKAEIGGHYSAYVSSGFVGHEGGNLLVQKTLEAINNMF